jgi:hypothetical protein
MELWRFARQRMRMRMKARGRGYYRRQNGTGVKEFGNLILEKGKRRDSEPAERHLYDQ